MQNPKIKLYEIENLSAHDYETISKLIIETWDYTTWVKKEDVFPMANLFLDTILLTSSKLIIAKDGQQIVGMLTASLTTGSLNKSKIRHNLLSSLTFLINGNHPKSIIDFYLETLKVNEQLIQKCQINFDAALNFLILNKSYKNKGIGSSLYQVFLDYLFTNKAKNFYVLTDDNSNYQFYEKKGLKRIASQKFS